MKRIRREPALAVAIVLAATAFLFWPLLAAPFGAPRWFEWDVPDQYWPDLVFLCDSLADAELPYWSPYDRGGYPVHADPQSGMYHPLNWGLCALSGLDPSLGWATARVAIGFALAGLFGLLWLRRIGASWAGATLGAVVIEAAPFMRHNWELNLTLAIAHLPLVLWAADRAVRERRAMDGALLALAIALMGWVGSPPALYVGALYAALYIVFVAAWELRRHGRAVARPMATTLGLALVLACGLLAVVIVPGAELAGHSVQSGRGYLEIAEGGLPLRALWALLRAEPGNHLYLGALPLALAAVAIARARVELRFFFGGAAVLAILLALGATTPLFRVAYELVPGVSMFRLPHRYEAWLGPSVGALAAFGLMHLAGAHARTQFIGTMWAVAVVVAVVLVDMTAALPWDRHLRAGPPPTTPANDAAVLAHAPQTDARYRYMDEFGMACRSGTRHRRRDFRGYQDPLTLAPYERVVARLRSTPALAPQFNVRWALQGPHFIHGWDRHFLPPPSELARLVGARVAWRGADERVVVELPALPLAYFVSADAVEVARDRASALVRVEALAPAPIAVLDDARDPATAPVAFSGTADRDAPLVAARVRSYSTDALTVEVDAPSDGVLVVNEVFYPGWTATVDGRPAPIHRANGLVRAVPLSAGPHAVAMAYRPPLARALRWLALLSLVAVGVVVWRRKWRVENRPWAVNLGCSRRTCGGRWGSRGVWSGGSRRSTWGRRGSGRFFRSGSRTSVS